MMDIRPQDKCVIQYKKEKGRSYSSFRGIVKENNQGLLEIKIGDKRGLLSQNDNIIIEFNKNKELKRYKANIKEINNSSMICSAIEYSIKDREFPRVDIMSGVSFRLWSQKNLLNNGICTNLSGNGMIIVGGFYASVGELLLIESIRLSEDFEIEENIIGRVVKFISSDSFADEYNRIVANFINIKESDRMNIMKFVNTKQKEDKDEEGW